MKSKITFLLLFISSVCLAQIEEIYDTAWRNHYVNGKFVFAKYDPVHGTEIWASDGTEEGTNILFDIVPGAASSNPNYLTVIEDVVYFQATNTHQIWRTDGTSGGTYAMTSSGMIDPMDFIKIDGFIFFRSGQNNNRKLYRMQTTPNSHIEVEISTNTVLDVSPIAKLNNNVGLFNVKFSSGWEIWRTNGTTTSFVADIDSGNSNRQQLGTGVLFNGMLYFSGYSTSTGEELWKTDGTTTGTEIVADIQDNSAGNVNCANCSSPSNFCVVGNTLYFSAENTSSGERELYKTNGSSASKVKEINPIGDSYPQFLTAYNNKLYFLARDTNDYQYTKIWESDGTSEGTIPLTDNNTNMYLLGLGGNVFNTIPIFDNHIIYNQYTPTYGNELWKYNLSTGVSELIQDYNQGYQGFLTYDYFKHNDELYFSGRIETENGYKMYKLGQSALSITDFDKNKMIKIYPNPTTDILNFSDKADKIEIIDQNGRILKKVHNSIIISIENLSSGMYYAKIYNGQQTEIQKIIKK